MQLEAEDGGDAEEREDEVQPKAKEVFQRLEGRMEEGVRAGKKSLPTRGNEVVVGNNLGGVVQVTAAAGCRRWENPCRTKADTRRWIRGKGTR